MVVTALAHVCLLCSFSTSLTGVFPENEIPNVRDTVHIQHTPAALATSAAAAAAATATATATAMLTPSLAHRVQHLKQQKLLVHLYHLAMHPVSQLVELSKIFVSCMGIAGVAFNPMAHLQVVKKIALSLSPT